MLGVEQWAEIRRMGHVEGLSQREIHRRTGIHRDTIRRALASAEPPSYGPRPPRPSKLDPFRTRSPPARRRADALGRADPRGDRGLGYRRGQTILDDLLRELRPRYLPPPRTFQRTVYRPGELCQFDLCEPRQEIPVGHGQTRRGFIVTAELPYSRAFAGALVFSKQLVGHRLGDEPLPRPARRAAREGWSGTARARSTAAAGGRPWTSPPSAVSSRSAGSSSIPATARPRARSSAATASSTATSRPGGSFANPLDFQDQLDRWSERSTGARHRTTRAIVSERLAGEHQQMRPAAGPMPDADRRWVIRVPPQPYLRFDRNDYSLDPRLVGRRVEVRAGQSRDQRRRARHRRARRPPPPRLRRRPDLHRPRPPAALDELRGERKRRREPEVEIRPLARYDALIPA